MRGINLLIRAFLRIDQKLSLIIDIMKMQAAHLTSPALDNPVWLDNQDVMQKLKISESTLRRRRVEGTIPCTRLGGKYFYKESDIQAVLMRE